MSKIQGLGSNKLWTSYFSSATEKVSSVVEWDRVMNIHVLSLNAFGHKALIFHQSLQLTQEAFEI